MATFTVNGKSVTVEKNQKLIRFLRDTLHLTSVKDGCSEGACGTCHVLIDGKPTKACIPQTDKLEGKTVLTIEGLSDWEKQVYTFAINGQTGELTCDVPADMGKSFGWFMGIFAGVCAVGYGLLVLLNAMGVL